MPNRVSADTVSDLVAGVLAHHVTDIFGVMGNGNAYLLDALPAHGLTYTPVRHEAAAVSAADTYFRVSNRLAAATTTYGPGLTNAITALTEAVQASVPLVLVAGAPATTGPKPWDVDQLALATSIGAKTFTVGADDVEAVTSAAIHYALDHRQPVIVAIPHDLVTAPATHREIPVPPRTQPVMPDEDAIARVAEVIGSARRLFILAGRGAHLAGASDALGALAEATGAITGTTALGRGIFPDARFDLGVTGGFGQHEAMALIEDADAVLVFGAGLNQFTTRFGRAFGQTARIVQIDVRDEPTHPAVTDFVRADARLAAEALASRIADRPSEAPRWRESVPELASGALRVRPSGEERTADGRLDPRIAAARLAELLPEDRVVVSDTGHFIEWANAYWPVASPERMNMLGTAFQSIGLGLPAMVGAAVARPETTIVLSSGDGGMLMSLADLESAVRVTRRGIIVVWNDAAYGAEVHRYGEWGLDRAPMLIAETDFAALAAATGARSTVVRRAADLDALAEWLDTGDDGVFLVDLRVSRSVVAPWVAEAPRD
ncbi:MAG TPA: thiamine pyrophosphate-binding protein [Microbacteriaceae bacterium]|nr:thiamine pyrophosphate-binding protein [Microbacteriaceae bacterium]